jgi:hypothetical protein
MPTQDTLFPDFMPSHRAGLKKMRSDNTIGISKAEDPAAYHREKSRRQRRKEQYVQWRHQYTKESIRYHFNCYLARCKKKEIGFSLSYDEFESLIQKPCVYCGEISSRGGVDRVDSSVGYIVENCVPCCEICNTMKMDMALSDFLIKIEKIYHFRIIGSIDND